LFGVKFSQYLNTKLTDLTSPVGTLFNRII